MFVSMTEVSRPAADPLDVAWLAGLLEGEGSFFPGPPSAPRLPVLAVAMTDEDVMARVGALLGRKVSSIRPRRQGWLPTFQVRVTGAKAVSWMIAVRPLLGRRRREQVDRALASYAPRTQRLFDDDQARDALSRLASGASVRSVAAQFGVSIWCVYDLRLGRT